MSSSTQIGPISRGQHSTLERYSATQGTQLAELAVTLPFLVVLLVGITDFGGALSLKHKLDIAVQNSARVAANQTMVDITNATPNSTDSVRQAVVANLVTLKIKDCGLATATGTKTALQWVYTAAGGGCPAPGLTLTIDRGNTFLANGVTIEASHLTLDYSYQWRFGQVVKLVAPTATYATVTTLRAEAVAQNLN